MHSIVSAVSAMRTLFHPYRKTPITDPPTVHTTHNVSGAKGKALPMYCTLYTCANLNFICSRSFHPSLFCISNNNGRRCCRKRGAEDALFKIASLLAPRFDLGCAGVLSYPDFTFFVSQFRCERRMQSFHSSLCDEYERDEKERFCLTLW